ncbi:hypothetical protein EVAR_77342_1 [Eumeta japonica]|uniref:Uncharacterized protein n=1 Tax=Eumeta variegata TaxID=151549 RepID=A0A4C1UYF8_EUMVA|nr:hypothetical protein EVAR_77342_1 [Eumeta japonica]
MLKLAQSLIQEYLIGFLVCLGSTSNMTAIMLKNGSSSKHTTILYDIYDAFYTTCESRIKKRTPASFAPGRFRAETPPALDPLPLPLPLTPAPRPALPALPSQDTRTVTASNLISAVQPRYAYDLTRYLNASKSSYAEIIDTFTLILYNFSTYMYPALLYLRDDVCIVMDGGANDSMRCYVGLWRRALWTRPRLLPMTWL